MKKIFFFLSVLLTTNNTLKSQSSHPINIETYSSFDKYSGKWSWENGNEVFSINLKVANLTFGEGGYSGMKVILGDYKYIFNNKVVIDTSKDKPKAICIISEEVPLTDTLLLNISDKISGEDKKAKLWLLDKNTLKMEVLEGKSVNGRKKGIPSKVIFKRMRP